MSSKWSANADAGQSPLPKRGRGLGEGEGVTGEGNSPKSRLLTMARTLRVSATDAEKLMWALLRDRQLLGLKFRRQHRVLGYIADFACSECRVIIELDGGQHNMPENRLRDADRTAVLEKSGWHVLRFWNNDVLANTEGTLASLIDYLVNLDTLTQPSPSGRERARPANA